MFLATTGQMAESAALAGQDMDLVFPAALLTSLLVSAMMMAVPGVCRLVKKERLPIKSGKRICLWNSILLFVIPTILGNNLIGGLGAICFYFINKWLFVAVPCKEGERGDYSENNSDCVTQCTVCGYSDSADFGTCPKCGSYAKQYVQLNEVQTGSSGKNLFCRKCGSALADDSVFCSKCGAQVTNES